MCMYYSIRIDERQYVYGTGGKIYRYLQLGLISTFVTSPVQLMAFWPGLRTGNSPLMALFMLAVPE